MTSPSHDAPDEADQPADGAPTEISKPIGDAIPTPVEPGLDQPLPEKKPEDGESDENGKVKP